MAPCLSSLLQRFDAGRRVILIHWPLQNDRVGWDGCGILSVVTFTELEASLNTS